MREQIRSSAGLAFWGLVFVVFDLNLGRLDVLSDPVGAIWCVMALGRLHGATPGGDSAPWRTARLWWVVIALVTGLGQIAVLNGLAVPDSAAMAADAVRHQAQPTAVLALLELLGLPAQFALIARFRSVAGSPQLARSWATSRRLLLVLGVPIALTSAVGHVYLLTTGRSFSMSLASGGASLALIGALVGLAATLHVLVSLRRTRNANDLEPAPA